MVNFTAIDVETANADLGSICQIGIVRFRNGQVNDVWETIINPVDYFDPINVSIHGINEEAVKEAPQLPDVYEDIKERLIDDIAVCHTLFDRTSLNRAARKYGLAELQCIWLDTAKIARRAWKDLAHSGYGLRNVAHTLGIGFNHHDAKEDARAAGEILLHAITATGFTVEQWLDMVKRPLDLSSSVSIQISMDGNPEGPLFGEVVVFTGALGIPRRLAAKLASDAGCKVEASVTKLTTMLVVGDQDIRRLVGHEKSSKHRKAEELIIKGQPIRVLGESDFQSLIAI